MRKFKYLFAFSAVALLSLTACGGNKNPYAALPEETDEDLLKQVEIVESLVNPQDEAEGSAIYGNVYLPSEIDGAKVSWWSSNPKVINPKANGDIAPGEVKRPNNKDAEVTLVAQLDKDGTKTKYQKTVTVKAAAPEIYDEDYEAYLFGHFVGESYGEGPQNIQEGHPTGEQIFFALADVGEGLHFKDMNGSTMNNLKPVLKSNVGELGVRDPFMLRSPEGDTFYLIATDLSVYTRGGWNNNAGQATKTGSHSIIIWESHDLVNWTEGRQIKVARDDAGMAWAPEMIYREETGEYLVFFSSTILDDYSKGTSASILYRDSVYYTTTRDFVHFGETKQFIPNTKYQDNVTSRNESDASALNNDFRKVIDGSVMKIGDYYYSAAKDGGNNEDGGGIRIQRTESLIPETDEDGNEYIDWEFVQNLADVGFQAEGRNADNKCLEGPEWFYLNQDDRKNPNEPEIGLMADFYANTSVGYIPWATTNVEDKNNANNSWRKLESGADKDFSWDNQTKRHGTILRITAEEAERLKEAYPITK